MTLSFDLWYWKVSCLEIVSWYAYPWNLIIISFLLHTTLVFKISTLCNHLLYMNTEGNDQGLTVMSSSYGTQKANHLCHKASDNQEQVTPSIQDVHPGRHLKIQRPCSPVLCGRYLHIHAVHIYNMPTQLHPSVFGDVTAHNIYACGRKYTTSSMSFGHPILGCSWKFSCVIRYDLNMEQLNTVYSF